MTSRRLRLTALAAMLVPVLAACGFSVQTDQVYQAAVGTNDRSGQVDILNAMIVSGKDGSGTLATTLVNTNQDNSDALTSVSGSGITAQGGSVPIRAGAAVNLAAANGKTPVFLTGPSIKAGDFVTLTLSFSSGQTTTVDVPVVENQGDYRDVPMQPSSSSSSSPSATPAG